MTCMHNKMFSSVGKNYGISNNACESLLSDCMNAKMDGMRGEIPDGIETTTSNAPSKQAPNEHLFM